MAAASRYGLVQQAPAWLVWVWRRDEWQAAGGDDDRLIAQQLARDVGGRVLRRGQAPGDEQPCKSRLRARAPKNSRRI